MSNKVRPHINQVVGLLKFTVLILTAFIVTAAPAAEALTAQERRSFANRGIYFIDDPCAFGAGSTVDLTGNDNAEKAFNFFVKNAGFSPDEAAGIVGNLIQESGVNPESDNPAAADIGGGGGIAQWEGGRWIALQEFAAEKGVPWSDLALQLAFIVEELGTTQGRAKKAMDALNDEGINADLLRSLLSSVLNHQLTSYENEMLDKLKAETNNATLSPARIAAVTFSITYERPHPNYANNKARGDNAESVLETFGAGVTGYAAGAGNGCAGLVASCTGEEGAYCWPLAPSTKIDYTTAPCGLDGGCHRGGQIDPAFDLYYHAPGVTSGRRDGAAGQPIYAITKGKLEGVDRQYCNPTSCSAQGRWCHALGIDGADGWNYWYGHILVDEKYKSGDEVQAGDQLGVAAPVEYGVKCWGGAPHLHIDRGWPKGASGGGCDGFQKCRDLGFVDLIDGLWEKLPDAQ